jgi:hypothetical protein
MLYCHDTDGFEFPTRLSGSLTKYVSNHKCHPLLKEERLVGWGDNPGAVSKLSGERVGEAIPDD